MSKKLEFNKSVAEFSIEDLTSRIYEDEVRLKKMTFAHVITPLENPMAIRSLRKDIARMKTELTKREQGV